jgi:hypothetical protein
LLNTLSTNYKIDARSASKKYTINSLHKFAIKNSLYNIDIRSADKKRKYYEMTCSLMIIRVLIAPQFLDLNIPGFKDVVLLVGTI